MCNFLNYLFLSYTSPKKNVKYFSSIQVLPNKVCLYEGTVIKMCNFLRLIQLQCASFCAPFHNRNK